MPLSFWTIKEIYFLSKMVWLWVLAFLIVVCILIFAFRRVTRRGEYEDLIVMGEEICKKRGHVVPEYDIVKSENGESRTLFFDEGPPRIEIHETPDNATLQLVFIHELTHVLLDSEEHDADFAQQQADLTLTAIELGYLGEDAEIEDDYPHA